MKVEKILIIRFRRVGDSVLGSTVCKSLRRTFPDAQIDYVLNENIASLFDHHPDIDNIITFSKNEYSNLFKFVLKIRKVMRKNKYDVIIDLRSTMRTLFFSVFSLSTPFRIGSRKKYNYLLHNYRIDNHCDDLKDMVQQDLMLLEPLEKITNVIYVNDFKLYVTEKEKEDYREYMKQQGIDFSSPVILASVITRLAYKAWDKEKMKEILLKVIEKYNAQIIFNFVGDEETFAMNLHKEMDLNSNIFTNFRANSLRELCSLLVNCDFFFGNEGGTRHISQALGVPSYAIYPPGILKSVWLPTPGEYFQGISPDDLADKEQQQNMDYTERFNLITVEAVWSNLDKMLENILKEKSNPES